MNYRLYGLSVSSEIELHALPSREEAQVYIHYDEDYERYMPEQYDWWVTVDGDGCKIMAEDTAVFFVREGKDIFIHAKPGANLETLKAFLTGVCFSAILMQRGAFSIHGSCLVKDGKTLLICGTSGAGKSTISAKLIELGWKLMADDIVPVFCEDGVYVTASSFPAQKMWQDTYDRFGGQRRIVGTLSRGGDFVKYQVDAMEQYADTAAPLNYGIMLTAGTEELLLREVTGFAKTDLLMKNRYMLRCVTDNEARGDQLRYCLGMARQMRLFLAERPQGVHTEDQIVEFLLREMEKDN